MVNPAPYKFTASLCARYLLKLEIFVYCQCVFACNSFEVHAKFEVLTVSWITLILFIAFCNKQHKGYRIMEYKQGKIYPLRKLNCFKRSLKLSGLGELNETERG